MAALIGNANTNEKVFQYVLSIFLALLQFFREDLKVHPSFEHCVARANLSYRRN